jgi:iron complex transport system permease protein
MTAVTAPAARSDRPASAARRLAGLLIAVAALSILLLLSVSVGSKDIPADVVIDALLDRSGQGDAVIWDMRIPRTVIGLAIGITLGVSGALIQALTRNPLADPGILGVDAGAAFFVTLGVGVFGISAVSGYVWFAFAGALVVTVAVYVIGSAGRGVADPIHLTLAGVALGALLTGFVTALILMDPNTFDRLRNWSAGSLVGRGLDVFLPVLPFLVVGVLLAAFVAPSLNAIALGEDLARSLGTNVALARALVIVAVTLLAGGATAIAGPIGFVGLMVPHVARWFTGPDQRWILAYTVLLAPSLVLAADILGRIVIRPGEFPVGIVTAFVGAPVLILLVRRRKASGL